MLDKVGRIRTILDLPSRDAPMRVPLSGVLFHSRHHLFQDGLHQELCVHSRRWTWARCQALSCATRAIQELEAVALRTTCGSPEL